MIKCEFTVRYAQHCTVQYGTTYVLVCICTVLCCTCESTIGKLTCRRRGWYGRLSMTFSLQRRGRQAVVSVRGRCGVKCDAYCTVLYSSRLALPYVVEEGWLVTYQQRLVVQSDRWRAARKPRKPQKQKQKQPRTCCGWVLLYIYGIDILYSTYYCTYTSYVGEVMLA